MLQICYRKNLFPVKHSAGKLNMFEGCILIPFELCLVLSSIRLNYMYFEEIESRENKKIIILKNLID